MLSIRKTEFRLGLKVLFVAVGLAVIQAVVPSRPSYGLVAAPDFGLSELVSFPNPCRLNTFIRYNLTATADSISIRVYDMEGRHIRTIDGGGTAIGSNQVEWDLLNGGGNGVANGVYLVRVEAKGGGRTTRDTIRVVVRR